MLPLAPTAGVTHVQPEGAVSARNVVGYVVPKRGVWSLSVGAAADDGPLLVTVIV
jgi:hypothetical protein